MAAIAIIKNCRVLGCVKCSSGNTHNCILCGDKDSTHSSKCCITLSPKDRTGGPNCRAKSCTGINCEIGGTHYCKVCKKHDVDHRSSKCPNFSSQFGIEAAEEKNLAAFEIIDANGN